LDVEDETDAEIARLQQEFIDLSKLEASRHEKK
jgi:hypothetical protein